MKTISRLAVVAVVALAGVGAAMLLRPLGCGSEPTGLLSSKVDEKAALTILRSETLAFLVTRRTASQLVIEHEESNLLGQWRGVLWATVSWRWGVDLQKISEKDIRREGDVIYCRLPEPQLLDFSVEPGSIGFMSKSTAYPKLLELLKGGYQRDVLERRLRKHAMDFADKQQLCPGRQEILRQLNEAASSILASSGVQIRFE